MPDVQGSRTLRKLARSAGSHAAELYRYTLGYSALALLVGAISIFSIPDLRAQALAAHQAVVTSSEPAAPPESVVVEGAAAIDSNAGKILAQAKPVNLAHTERSQVESLQRYIGNKYKVPTSAVRSLVATAWDVGSTMKLDPLLLLAVMAIESRFDPFAESGVGAQGLMQVMTRIHHKKFEPFGGTHAAWRPDANIEVGAQILKDCIERRGSVAGGLTCYVGSSGTASSYGRKVLAERDRLRAVLGPARDTGVNLASTRGEDATESIASSAVSRVAEGGQQRLARNEVTASLTLRAQSVAGM